MVRDFTSASWCCCNTFFFIERTVLAGKTLWRSKHRNKEIAANSQAAPKFEPEKILCFRRISWHQASALVRYSRSWSRRLITCMCTLQVIYNYISTQDSLIACGTPQSLCGFAVFLYLISACFLHAEPQGTFLAHLRAHQAKVASQLYRWTVRII